MSPSRGSEEGSEVERDIEWRVRKSDRMMEEIREVLKEREGDRGEVRTRLRACIILRVEACGA